MAGVQFSPHMAIHRKPPILRMASCPIHWTGYCVALIRQLSGADLIGVSSLTDKLVFPAFLLVLPCGNQVSVIE